MVYGVCKGLSETSPISINIRILMEPCICTHMFIKRTIITFTPKISFNDPDYYKNYERKQISKAEAIFRAKALMAKEKGLSKSMVKKYFSQTED